MFVLLRRQEEPASPSAQADAYSAASSSVRPTNDNNNAFTANPLRDSAPPSLLQQQQQGLDSVEGGGHLRSSNTGKLSTSHQLVEQASGLLNTGSGPLTLLTHLRDAYQLYDEPGPGRMLLYCGLRVRIGERAPARGGPPAGLGLRTDIR